MKTIRLIVIAAILLVACGCNETCQPTAWIITGSDVDAQDNPITGRVGLKAEGIEFGAELNYAGGHVERESYGAYMIYQLEPTAVGTPYIGYHALMALEDVEEMHGPMVGDLIPISETESLLVMAVIEGQYYDNVDENEQYRAFAGLRIEY